MTRKLGWLLLVTALAVPCTASAQGAGSAAAPLTEEQQQAQQHFQRAKDLYQAGSYRDAIGELEQAHELDPKAKELVFNLGIVHERLAKFDEAIGWFQKYLEMDGITPAERAKAESIIKRIEGAKREVSATNGASPPPPPPPGDSLAGPEKPEPPPEPSRGRVDALTIAAGSVAVVGLGVGTVFGILAVGSRPPSGFVTGRDGSYADLESDTKNAHTSAVVADIGFGVGIVAAVATAVLYFGRTKDAAPAASSSARILPSAAPLAGGGGVGGALSAVGTF